jgi:hypothetical protein
MPNSPRFVARAYMPQEFHHGMKAVSLQEDFSAIHVPTHHIFRAQVSQR